MPAVYPLTWVPTTWRGNYPHFSKRDAPVWARWLELYADRYTAFAYDVALGGSELANLVGTPAELQAWRYSTALKIDAVGLADDAAWIFEVRPGATVSALGSALAYALVAERDSVFPVPLVSAVVCEFMQPDVRWACDRLGVRVFTV